jgi:hypothetical protein
VAVTTDNDWGNPKPADDDGPEAAFERAMRKAIREDAEERRREAGLRRLKAAVEAYVAKKAGK